MEDSIFFQVEDSIFFHEKRSKWISDSYLNQDFQFKAKTKSCQNAPLASVSAAVDQSAASDLVKLTENETEDSFHSDQRDDSVDQEPLDSEESNFSISSEALSQVSSLDSQLSWIQENYMETNECRFPISNECRY